MGEVSMLFYESSKVYMNQGYPTVFLDGKNIWIHRLEWMRNYGEIPKGLIIHHKDENKLNWNINNLELLTRAEHVLKHLDVVGRKGVKVFAYKNEIKYEFDSIELAAKHCGTHTMSIQRVFKGIQKQANGWFFERGDN